MMVVVININIIGTVRLPDLSWVLRSRNATQAVATCLLVTKPSVKARATSWAAPEISREISFKLGWELGRHGIPATVAASQPLELCKVMSMLRRCKSFGKRVSSSAVSPPTPGQLRSRGGWLLCSPCHRPCRTSLLVGYDWHLTHRELSCILAIPVSPTLLPAHTEEQEPWFRITKNLIASMRRIFF